jgi:hypothetical protein
MPHLMNGSPSLAQLSLKAWIGRAIVGEREAADGDSVGATFGGAFGGVLGAALGSALGATLGATLRRTLGATNLG